jgi:hypothetical protein
MSSVTTPESLFEQLSRDSGRRRLPPVERWHPAVRGDSQMSIAADGRWFYRGSEITRPAMVRLFSTILRRDGERHLLVTPAEALDIAVDDAPFVAVDFETRGRDAEQQIAFSTNVGDIVVAGREHPIAFEDRGRGARPYVNVRARLDAVISRGAYYRLVELAVPNGSELGVWSDGVFFVLSRATSRYMLG